MKEYLITTKFEIGETVKLMRDTTNKEGFKQPITGLVVNNIIISITKRRGIKIYYGFEYNSEASFWTQSGNKYPEEWIEKD